MIPCIRCVKDRALHDALEELAAREFWIVKREALRTLREGN